jgi:polysaccharide export outer membrane protein
MCYVQPMRLLCLAVAVALTSPVALLADQEVPDDPSRSTAYTIGAGDVLRVEAFTHDEISGSFAVEVDGEISFPLLGRVRVEGSTTSEIGRRLEALLEKDYYVDVQLQVEVEEFRSQPVTVLGEVARPGTFYLEGQTSLHAILAEAGGIKTTAGSSIELRRLQSEPDDGTPVVRVFPTEGVRSGEVGRDVVLQPGDVVSVSAKQQYFITGEISQPGQYDLSPGMTLMQAISQSGGLGKFASQTIEIHRGGNGEKEIMTFDLSHIRKGRNPDPTIEAGDVLIVRRRFF